MSIFGGNKTPKPPEIETPPPPPPKPPTADDAAGSEEAQKNKAIALKSLGREQTIATSQKGVEEEANVKVKKLTGQ